MKHTLAFVLILAALSSCATPERGVTATNISFPSPAVVGGGNNAAGLTTQDAVVLHALASKRKH